MADIAARNLHEAAICDRQIATQVLAAHWSVSNVCHLR